VTRDPPAINKIIHTVKVLFEGGGGD
jgi:hypothetical protein